MFKDITVHQPNEISIQKYIDRFEPWLISQGLVAKTIRRHVDNS